MPSISFYNADVKLSFKSKRILKELLLSLFSVEGKSLQSLSIIFCSDEYLLQLNNQFLNHNYYTDILTFDLSVDEKIIAEIYISIDRIKENGFLRQLPFLNELLRVIFHGALHLCGYGDKTFEQKEKMTEQEDHYLKKFYSFHVKQN